MKLFIPRVRLDVSFQVLDKVFQELNIGNVVYADFHYRKGYQYVFVEIATFMEIDSNYFEGRKASIVFKDENNKKIKWEIKPYLPMEDRYKEEDKYPETVMSVYNHVFE